MRDKKKITTDQPLTDRELLMSIQAQVQNCATKDDLKPFATRDDLQAFATKDDLQPFATKDDLQPFATKDDIKAFATKDDIKRLERKLSSYNQANIQHHLRTREEVGRLNNKVGQMQDGLRQATGLA